VGVGKLKILRVNILVLSLISFAANAEDLSIPHSFTAGTSIKSSEMNENFTTISNVVNQQNSAMTIATSETNEALSAISTAVNQQTEVMTTIDEGVSSIETGVSGVNQSIDSNGLTLSDINSMLSTINESLTSIDTKLSTTASDTDQLICVAYYSWPTSGDPFSCVLNSAPTNIRSLTYAQVAQEEWLMTSVGGGDSLKVVFIFSK